MFDAEIAAKLLNRAMARATDESRGRHLDVLREGALVFSHRIANVMVDDSSSETPLQIELLTFGDGSQALRIRAGNPGASWSEWVSTTQVIGTQSLTNDDGEFWPHGVRRLSLSDLH
jgi:hypothetical protein